MRYTFHRREPVWEKCSERVWRQQKKSWREAKKWSAIHEFWIISIKTLLSTHLIDAHKHKSPEVPDTTAQWTLQRSQSVTMIADCNERQEARREVTTARALMKPTETNLIRDLVGALLGVFFLCGARCTCTCTYTSLV